MSPEPSEITLAILAGGEGSRMGKPKGLLQVRGRPILAYLLDRFRWPGPTLLVTAPGREHPPGWEAFTREAVDPVAGQGPLRGVLTALEGSETALTLVTTVDMPEIGFDQLAWLGKELGEDDEARGMLLERPGEPGRIEPFPSIFRREAAELIRSRLRAGSFSVHSMSTCAGMQLSVAPAEWTERVWTNLNRPGEFERWVVDR